MEDPSLSREEILAPEDPEHVAEVRRILEEHGYDTSGFDWRLTTRPDWPVEIHAQYLVVLGERDDKEEEIEGLHVALDELFAILDAGNDYDTLLLKDIDKWRERFFG